MVPAPIVTVPPLLLAALVKVTATASPSGSVSILVRSDAAKLTGVSRRVEIEYTPASGGVFTTCCGFRLPEQPLKLPLGSEKTAVTVLLPWVRAEPRTVRAA